MSNPSCMKCKHSYINGNSLTCRRYPPTVLVEEVVNHNNAKYQVITSRFPEVNELDTCGEFNAQG